MEGVSIGLKKRGKRRRAVHGISAPGVKRTAVAAFGDGGDSDDSQTHTRPVTKIVNAVPGVDKKASSSLADKTAPASSPKLTETAPDLRLKQSQIAKLVASRKKAEGELKTLHREADGNDSAVFRYDLSKCPDNAAPSAYRSTPVEGFGERMLKAMGWKGPKPEVSSRTGPNTTQRKPRIPRLGLGAKPGQLPSLPEDGKQNTPAEPLDGTKRTLSSSDPKANGRDSEDEISGKSR